VKGSTKRGGKTVNVVSVMAHQDDELMCLGTMLKMQDRGDSLHFVCVTDGCGGMVQAPEMPREEAAAIRDREMRDLAGRLGASYACLGERDEYLFDTPDVRDGLIQSLRACRADVVFTHFHPDYNLDHMTVNLLVRQCAMQAPLPMIHTASAPLAAAPAVFLVEPAGGFVFEPTHYVDVTAQIERKRELARCHRSQDEAFHAGLGKGLDDWILETSRYRGSQVDVPHAEGFRPMLSRGFVKPWPVLP
jgi:LmbE family N-acetylglucosaminyl deacetylase